MRLTHRQRLNAMGLVFVIFALGCALFAYFAPSLEGYPSFIRENFDPSFSGNQEGYYAIGGIFGCLALFCFFR